jgi:hypothetical protein
VKRGRIIRCARLEGFKMSSPEQFGNYNPPPAFRQARDPAATDDASKRVAFGSLWVNPLSSKAFICADPIIGGAVWYQIAPAGGGSGAFLALENAALAPEKISALAALAVPPAALGAMVCVVVPGDIVNYASPISTLLTGAAGTGAVQGESFNLVGGVGNGAYGGDVVFHGGAELTALACGGDAIGVGGAGAGGGGGLAALIGGADSAGAAGGNALLLGGATSGGFGGAVQIAGGADSAAGAGGSTQISGGASTGGVGGNVEIACATGGAGNGLILLTNLPTVAPATSGALWLNAGVLSIVP